MDTREILKEKAAEAVPEHSEKTYPPVDARFYELGEKDGLSDAQIEEDWKMYCSELERWLDDTQATNPPASPKETDRDQTPKCMCGMPIPDGEPCNACRVELTVGHEELG